MTLKACPHGCFASDPTWDHRDACPYWPGTEWARRHGYMEDCGGLVDCGEVHPYTPHELCGCEGECFYCSHIGCERCVEKAWADRPWWQRLLRRRPKSIWEWQPFG